MPITVEDVLKESGFTDEQIKALDPKAISAFGGVLTAAEKERQQAAAAKEAAELAQRAQEDFYDNKVAPALVGWEEDKTRISNESAKSAAELAFMRTWAEEQKKNGVITEIPTFDSSKFIPAATPAPQRDAQGRYVANVPGATPGSPTFDVNQVYQKAGDAIGVIADIQWEHQRLFGQPMPISPTELVRQADALKLDPKTYASRTYNWDARRQQIQAEEKLREKEKIAAEAVAPYEAKYKELEEKAKKAEADLRREFAERTGNNPDMRVPQASPRMTEIAKAARENPQQFDPLNMNEQQRRAATARAIREDIASQVA